MSDAIPCPNCGHGVSKVKDSRQMNGFIRRRRICQGSTCKFRFNTYEAVGDRPPAEAERLVRRLEKAHAAAEKLFSIAEDVKVLTQ